MIFKNYREFAIKDKSRQKKIYRLIFFILNFCPILLSAQIDYMKFNSGQDKNNFDKNLQASCFIPFSKAFKRMENYLIFSVPDKTKVQYAFTGLKEVEVKPSHIYKLRLSALGAERIYLYLNAYFNCANSKTAPVKIPLLKYIFFLNQNGMTSIEKEFAVPAGAKSMILAIETKADASNRKLSSGNKIIIKNLTITEERPIVTLPKKFICKNLLPYGDFQKFPLGEFNEIYRGSHSDPNRRWPKFDAEVVKFKGVKCLKITREKKSYPYPFFTTKRLPVNIENCFVKATATVRGKGIIKLGLWWDRKGYFDRDYMNKIVHKLDDNWTTITEIRACLSPFVTNADVSITSYDDAEIYVKDISLELMNP